MRMTDERLAEIEATLYEDTDNIEELLQALKAERERITELDGSLEEWKLDFQSLKDRNAELEDAILKNIDISWEPWKSLFPQPGEKTDGGKVHLDYVNKHIRKKC